MVTWPEDDLTNTYLDADTDSVGLARSELNAAVLKIKEILGSGTAKGEIDTEVSTGSYMGAALWDTSAWRDRCAGLSWHTELGDIPALVIVTIKTGASGVIELYDCTDPLTPLWLSLTDVYLTGAVEVIGSKLLVGRVAGLFDFDFLDGRVGLYHPITSAGGYGGLISEGDARGAGFLDWDGSFPGIIGTNVNDIATTIKDGAPIDATTGLPVPVIAVATSSGPSLLIEDGSIYDGTVGIVDAIAMDQYRLYCCIGNNVLFSDLSAVTSDAWPFTVLDQSSTPEFGGAASDIKAFKGIVAKGCDDKLKLLKENPTTPEEGMVNYITHEYQSGWMYGEIKGAWLASTDDTDLVGGTDTDRSVNVNGLPVNGTIDRNPVAPGAELMGYSGFTTVDYLQNDAPATFGAADFHISIWAKQPTTAGNQRIFMIGQSAGPYMGAYLDSNGILRFEVYDLTTYASVVTTVSITDTEWHNYVCVLRGDTLELWQEGILVSSSNVATHALSSSSNPVTIGAMRDGASPAYTTSLALARIGEGAPSAEQIEFCYSWEKRLFQENAKCTLAGTSDAILNLAYDKVKEELHVLTSYGRSVLKDGLLVDSEATPVGTPAAVDVHAGTIVQAGSTSVDFYSPADNLRTELLRVDEQQATFGSPLETFWELGDASETNFTLLSGWRPKAVYNAGLLVKEGASDEYTVEYDGFKYTISFAVAPTSGSDIAIMAVRV